MSIFTCPHHLKKNKSPRANEQLRESVLLLESMTRWSGVRLLLVAVVFLLSSKNTAHSLKQSQKRIGTPTSVGKSIRSSTSSLLQHRNRSGPTTSQKQLSTMPEDATVSRQSLRVLQSLSFLLILSSSLVGFAPAPALIAKLGPELASSTLSALSASAALTQIVASPALGSILDSVGRKPALISCVLAIALANGTVSVDPAVASICAAKFVGMLCVGFFFLTAQAMMSDIAASNPDQLSAAMGVQMALLGAGFLVGSIAAGQLSEMSLSVTYGVSALVAAVAFMLAKFGMTETLPPLKRLPFEPHAARKLLLQSPLSCTRLLVGHGQEMRILAILLMLQSFPMNMGDLLQVYSKTEWNLTTKEFSSFFAVFGVLGIVANTAGSLLVRTLGIRRFTGIAIISSMCAPIGASFFGFRGILMGAIIGFLGAAQSMGIAGALVSQGQRAGVPQGELAGERSSLVALLKVIGPVWYSTLYIQGQKLLGVKTLPFFFNIAMAVAALVISQVHL